MAPEEPAKRKERAKAVRSYFDQRSKNLANRFREKAAEWYGKEKAAQVQYVEAYEVCEYGRRPDKAELKRLFPFFD
jgi:hypothetical protein